MAHELTWIFKESQPIFSCKHLGFSLCPMLWHCTALWLLPLCWIAFSIWQVRPLSLGVLKFSLTVSWRVSARRVWVFTRWYLCSGQDSFPGVSPLLPHTGSGVGWVWLKMPSADSYIWMPSHEGVALFERIKWCALVEKVSLGVGFEVSKVHVSAYGSG